MKSSIVHNPDPVTLVGGGVYRPDDLRLALDHAPCLVAADGGANELVSLGCTPNAVIGDLDSLSVNAKVAFSKVLHHVREQDTTDFEKCLTRIAAPLVLAVGFTGGRLDHTLSILNAMARHRDRPVIVIGPDDIGFLVPLSKIELSLPVGTRLSLMPLADARVDTAGLRWEVKDAAMHPARAVSISNETVAPEVTIHAMGPLLIILPQAALAVAITAVRAQSHKGLPQP
jgi:thiamine pyrophosphokinase